MPASPRKPQTRVLNGVASLLGGGMYGLSALLLGAMSLFYGFRPDWCAAVTIWPPWAWLFPGLVLAIAGRRRVGAKAVGALVVMWVVYLLAFAEEPHSLTRLGPWPDPQWKKAVKAGRAIRVISLNCAGGSAEAALETVRYKPDIVLLQESPSRHETSELARQLYKSDLGCVWGLDTSILTGGTAFKAPLSPLKPFVAARVRLPTGMSVEVISLRLFPPSASIDLWSPRCWREHAQNRRLRRRQVRDIMKFVKTMPRGLPLVIGGDFNAPAGDAVFHLLQPRLRDAFAEAGLGLGNTAVNQFPFSRIDQIWIGDRFRAASVVTRETRHSDHRMVICDLLLRPRTGPTASRRRAR